MCLCYYFSSLARTSKIIFYKSQFKDINPKEAQNLSKIWSIYLSNYNKLSEIMKKYLCLPCGYIYDPDEGDPENGIFPGTPFEDLPDDWTCPACGVGKEHFEEI